MDYGIVLIQIVVILFALSFHESAHAWSANKFGDPTAKMLGRITLNPMAHIDLFGTVIFPLLLIISGAPVFGWAKPVPVNPLNIRDWKKGNLWISAAGPLSNIALGILGVILWWILGFGRSGTATGLLHLLDAPPSVFNFLGNFLLYFIYVNFLLAVFNLIPVHPLDGSGVLTGLLPDDLAESYERLVRPYGFFFLFVLLMTGMLRFVRMPVELICEMVM